jgi:hypothetical protein
MAGAPSWESGFGHILPVEIVSDPIPWRDPAIPERLVRAMSMRIRMWSLDPVAENVDEMLRLWRTTQAGA